VLETLTLDKLTAHKKRELAITFGELVYDGQWFSPLRKALNAFVTATQEHVTGKVRLELYKGNLINAGVWSPYSLYREDIATFAAGGDYKQSDATGFISIYGLPTKVQAIVSSEKEGERSGLLCESKREFRHGRRSGQNSLWFYRMHQRITSFVSSFFIAPPLLTLFRLLWSAPGT